MQKIQKIDFSEIGIKQHKRKRLNFFFKNAKKTPPSPLFNFYEILRSFINFTKIAATNSIFGVC